MRTVKLSNGAEIEVRGLKRPEIRDLKQFGVGHAQWDIERKDFDEVMNKVLEGQFEPVILDDIANVDLLALFNGIIAETYSTEDEEKNSSMSGRSDQTAAA